MSGKSKKTREKEAEPQDQYQYKAPLSFGGKVVTEPGIMGKPTRIAEQSYESPEDATVIVKVRMTERDGPSKKGAPRVLVNDASINVIHVGANNTIVDAYAAGGTDANGSDGFVKKATTINGQPKPIDMSLNSKEVLDMIRASLKDNVFDAREAQQIATKLLGQPAKEESSLALKSKIARLP